MYKKYYSHFLNANSGKQHFACHSHHYWPDVTREAHINYWDDSAKYVDHKWEYFFTDKIPATQKLIAENLSLSHPEQITFAPNTHEFVFRILSCLDFNKKIKILTTDSEFYSFDRQINRFKEFKNVEVVKISTMPFDNFEERFIKAIQEDSYDLVFFSHVFFNSGMVVKNFEKIISAVTNSNTIIVIDGYHGFMAVPTNLANVESRAFYLAGSYKYAQGGEGCCFLYTPKGNQLRPLYTGWFAGLSSLGSMNDEVTYPDDGLRFAGSTMDFSALYRLHAVLNLFKQEGLTTKKIHEHIQKVQQKFRHHLLELDHFYITEKNILSVDYNHHGHFYTFAMPNNDVTKRLHDDLAAHQIFTDYRGSKLRFGFGLYHDGEFDLSYLKDQRKI